MVSLSGSSDPITSAVVVTGYAGTPEAAQALAQAGVEAHRRGGRERGEQVAAAGLERRAAWCVWTPVDNASLPAAPFTPNYARNLLLGGFVGILLGYLAAFVRMNLDRKLRSVDEVEELDRDSGAGHRARRQGPRPPSDREHRRLQPRPRGRGLPPAAHQLPVRRRRQPDPQRGDHQRQRGRGQVHGGGQPGPRARQRRSGDRPGRRRPAPARWSPASSASTRRSAWPRCWSAT